MIKIEYWLWLRVRQPAGPSQDCVCDLLPRQGCVQMLLLTWACQALGARGLKGREVKSACSGLLVLGGRKTASDNARPMPPAPQLCPTPPVNPSSQVLLQTRSTRCPGILTGQERWLSLCVLEPSLGAPGIAGTPLLLCGLLSPPLGAHGLGELQVFRISVC